MFENIKSHCFDCKIPIYDDEGDYVRVSKEEWFFPRYYCGECAKSQNLLNA